MTNDGREQALNKATSDKLSKQIIQVAGEGLRVLGVAIALDGGNMKDISAQNASEKLSNTDEYEQKEGNCAFLGYVCIKDPVRPEVK